MRISKLAVSLRNWNFISEANLLSLDFIKSYLFRTLPLLALINLSFQGLGQGTILDADVVQKTNITAFKNLNTEYLEFSPVMYDQGLVYVSSQERGEIYDSEINESFFDLKYFNLNSESAAPMDFSKAINTTNVHKGPCAFSQQERVIYYTKERRFSDGRDAVLKIFKAYKDENEWIPDDEFPHNSDDYSNMHPAVSPDGSFMVLASNKGGGNGGYDLYISNYINGYWQSPENLGPSVNSSGNELFPFVHENGTIFFSSDGRGGEGNLDLFVSEKKGDAWVEAENIISPFNSPADDFGISVNPEGDYGFITSNRKGGIGKDDIYEFESEMSIFKQKATAPKPKPDLTEIFQFSTRVLDRGTKLPLQNVEVFAVPFIREDDKLVLSNFTIKSIDAVSNQEDIIVSLVPDAEISAQFLRLSDENGLASFALNRNKRYFLLAQMEGYKKAQTAIDAVNIIPEITLLMEKVEAPKIAVPPVSSPARVEDALNRRELIVFNQIYYDYNSAFVKVRAMQELDLLANYLIRNPDLRVQLTAYTDARGTREYNQQLSADRGQSAKRYLVNRGISDFRIIAVGKGENNIRNHCANGVLCSDQEHEYNRRTEVQILEY